MVDSQLMSPVDIILMSIQNVLPTEKLHQYEPSHLLQSSSQHGSRRMATDTSAMQHHLRNVLPDDVKCAVSLDTLKSKLKHCLFNRNV